MKKHWALAFLAAWIFILFCFVILFLLSGTRGGLDLTIALLFGWWSYLSDVLPRLRWNWDAWLFAVLMLLLGGFGLHAVLRWWNLSRKNPAWKLRQTSLVLALGIVVCGAALAAAGILHHGIWLTKMRDLYEVGGRGLATMKLGQMKQAGLALRLWMVDHDGRLPESLDQLYPDYTPFRDVLFDGRLGKQVVSPWLYFGAGQKDFPPTAVLLASNSLGNGRRIVVYGDMRGDIISEEEFQNTLARFPHLRA